MKSKVHKVLSKAQAILKFELWHVAAESIRSSEVYSKLQELRLPTEVVDVLYSLIDKTKKIGGRVFNVGKIVLLKVIDFVKAHPFLSLGIASGIFVGHNILLVGHAITGLISHVPFLSSLLTPISAKITAILSVIPSIVGAILGYRLDKKIPDIGQNAKEILEAFFSLLIEVFNTIIDNDNIEPSPA
jgi:ElaB/YqjD/DUF883 family membrane-anchored ribosome-binding protein